MQKALWQLYIKYKVVLHALFSTLLSVQQHSWVTGKKSALFSFEDT